MDQGQLQADAGLKSADIMPLNQWHQWRGPPEAAASKGEGLWKVYLMIDQQGFGVEQRVLDAHAACFSRNQRWTAGSVSKRVAAVFKRARVGSGHESANCSARKRGRRETIFAAPGIHGLAREIDAGREWRQNFVLLVCNPWELRGNGEIPRFGIHDLAVSLGR